MSEGLIHLDSIKMPIGMLDISTLRDISVLFIHLRLRLLFANRKHVTLPERHCKEPKHHTFGIAYKCIYSVM